ncbi:MAG: SMI1/KNR4 family protein [Lachnospiraceae bacterium]|nr:SMI1/KNR4 family protein [Lachnospiraceae bacterium]
MIIETISRFYEDNILLFDPIKNVPDDLGAELGEILAQSNGIQEVFFNPETGDTEVLGWIIYSLEKIQEETAFYKENYNIQGIVFSDDGAGNPFYIVEDKIYKYNAIDDESELCANSLEEFYTK